MSHRLTRPTRATVATVGGVLFAILAALSLWPMETSRIANAQPPEDAGYTGAKRCSSCHFKEFMVWKESAHAKAFENMPTKYKRGADTSCFTCHMTGYGHPKGYKGAETADLLGVTCESCHGPGSAHETAAKKYVDKKELTPEEKEEVNSVLYKLIPEGCIGCHITQGGHKPHPEYEKE